MCKRHGPHTRAGQALRPRRPAYRYKRSQAQESRPCPAQRHKGLVPVGILKDMRTRHGAADSAARPRRRVREYLVPDPISTVGRVRLIGNPYATIALSARTSGAPLNGRAGADPATA